MRIVYNGKFERPSYKTEGSAGIDLRNNEEHDFVMAMDETCEFGTGVKIEIPKGYVGLVFPRSSLGFTKSTSLVNGTGVIDSDYRGEIRIKLINKGKESVKIESGERVCQLVIVPYLRESLEFVTELNTTERGESGFGSTGSK